MTKAQAREILVEAFRALPKNQRDNLLYHAEKGTRILCGARAEDWATEEAG